MFALLSTLAALAFPFYTVHVSLDTMDGPPNCALCLQEGWQRTLSLLAGGLTFFFSASIIWRVYVGRSDCLCWTKCPLASKAPFGCGLQCSFLWTDWPCEAQWTGFCHSGQLHMQRSRWVVNPGRKGICIIFLNIILHTHFIYSTSFYVWYVPNFGYLRNKIRRCSCLLDFWCV